jgi:hypothetical protein
MPITKRGSSATLELRAGQALSVSAGGTIAQIGGGIAYDFRGWAAVIGPFTTNESFVLNAVDADIEYSTPREQVYSGRMNDQFTLVESLPAVGQPGVLYSTTEGLRYWYQPTGQYLALDGVPSAPVNDTPPVISGEAEVDAVLSLDSVGVWDHRPTSYTFQWCIDGTEVEDAVGRTFVVPEEAADADVTCEVTATNVVGDSDPEASNEIAIPSGE